MSRSLRQHFLGADAAAYQGVKAAYCGWYRGACGRAAEGPSEPAMTPYIRAVLALASDIAGAARIEPEHLLAAMLDYAPGAGAAQPGVQYLLSMLEPGLQSVRRDFAYHLARPASAEGLAPVPGQT